MTLNLCKCSVMHMSNKRDTLSTKYTINGFPFNCISGVKYLINLISYVSISCKMSWNDHTDDICTKTRKSLGLICRNLRNCPQYVRNQAYTPHVRPMFEYDSCVLDPYERKQIKQLESVQRHAAGFTTGNYYSMIPGCVTNMVTQLGWDLLERR